MRAKVTSRHSFFCIGADMQFTSQDSYWAAIQITSGKEELLILPYVSGEHFNHTFIFPFSKKEMF